jgi:hypothetical protein
VKREMNGRREENVFQFLRIKNVLGKTIEPLGNLLGVVTLRFIEQNE